MAEKTRLMFVVPEGWTVETRNADEEIISSPSRYHVTLDWADRKPRPGITTVGKAINETEYKGRGWQKRMIDDALAFLEKLEATKLR